MADENLLKRVRKIKKAFSDLDHPDNDNIVYDNNSDYDELVETAQAFTGKHWNEITLETLLENYERIPFLSDIASRFYLPAFMIATLLHFEEVGFLSWNTINFLTPYEDGIEKLKRIKSFCDAEQKAAIREFCQAFAETDPDFFKYTSENGKLDILLAFWQ
jgi:hypothetical protein